MSTTKPWGGVGAWALDAERAEAEERELAEAAPPAPASASASDNFPSLKEATAAGKSKKKKQTLSLAEFTTGAYKGLTQDDMLRLPTGPRERSAEDLDRNRLGGGFRSYGGDGYSSGRRGGGFDDELRRGGPPPSRVSDLDQPSRADEVDNWARDKKSFTPLTDPSRRDRYGSLGTGGGSSRADETDDWSRDKKPIASRHPTFGSGFRDSAGSSDSDRWVQNVQPQNGDRERPRLVLNPPKRVDSSAQSSEPARTRPSPFGAARPREEVLAEKGLDWRKMESEIEIKKSSRPTSSHSSRPSSAQSSRPGSPGSAVGDGPVVRPRPKVNPFGDAKPREVVLEEKGKDWRKIDLELEHKRVDRPETAEEKMLKEVIDYLKSELKETESQSKPDQISSEEIIKELKEKIHLREKELQLLIIELDDKVRFGQRAADVNRPGSGAGRSAAAMYTQDVAPEEAWMNAVNVEIVDRPRSSSSSGRGEENKWGFQGTRDRASSFASRNSDRESTRPRW